MKYKYWVIFPQAIHIYDNKDKLESNSWYASSSVMHAKSKKDARGILEFFNGAYIEKLERDTVENTIYCVGAETRTEDSELDYNQLYDKYGTLPPVKAISNNSDDILFDALDNLHKFVPSPEEMEEMIKLSNEVIEEIIAEENEEV